MFDLKAILGDVVQKDVLPTLKSLPEFAESQDKLKHMKLLELGANLLGHGTLAGLQARGAQQAVALRDANYIVLRRNLAYRRARNAFGFTPQQTDLLIARLGQQLGYALRDALPSVSVSMDEDALVRDVLLEVAAEKTTVDSGNVSDVLAETNAYAFFNPSYEDFESPLELHEVKEGDKWEVQLSGQWDLEQDEDRPYSGDELSLDTTFICQRVGIIGLSFHDLEVSASVRYSFEDVDTVSEFVSAEDAQQLALMHDELAVIQSEMGEARSFYRGRDRSVDAATDPDD